MTEVLERGRTILITGGTSMLATASARCLLRDGWNVVLADIDPAVHAVTDELSGAGPISCVQFDVTDRAAVDAAVTTTVSEFGGLAALVNVAGGLRGLGMAAKPFLDMSPPDWERILAPNLIGVLNMCHSVLPHLQCAKGGSVVSIAASRGLQGGANASIYSAAKAAVIVFTQALAQEVGPSGVRVNTIAPGNAEARWKTGALAEIVTSPLGRETTATDVGEAVAFLVSDRAAHITGSCLDVSGGVALH